MASEIRFAVAQVSADGLPFQVTLLQAWLDSAIGDAGMCAAKDHPAAQVSGRLSRSGRDIVVRARVVAGVTVPCARCLQPTLIQVDAELALLLSPSSSARGESRSGRQGGRQGGGNDEHEFTAAEADMDTYDGESIILDSFVRELILLEVPSFPLCREDCPGIPSNAGQREPTADIDPRLAPLNAFRKKDGPTNLQDLVDAAASRAESMGRKPILRSNARGRMGNKKK